MLHEIQLNGLPETTDSLAWSEAGDLCVATGGKIQLYLPKRKPSTQGVKQPGLKPWLYVILQVNTFGIKEWPELKQRPYADLSLGEELSDSHVISCSWSATGLAAHERCALGILTANGLYSVWDVDGELALKSSWARKIVVNRVLGGCFGGAEKNLEGGGFVVDGQAARRVRVRAGIWAKSTKAEKSVSRAGLHLLALLNDHGEIIILQVKASRDDGGEYSYTAQILHVLDLERRLQLYPDGLLDELQWLDWTTQQSDLVSTIICSTEGKTWSIRAKATDKPDVSVEVQCALSEPARRKIPAWHMPKSQIFMLGNQHLIDQQRQLQQRWESARAEDYPAMTRYYGMATYKDFQAIQISFHPRTVPEYLIAAQEMSWIIFSHKSLAESPANAENIVFEFEDTAAADVFLDGTESVWTYLLAKAGDLGAEIDQDNIRSSLYSQIIPLYLAQAFLNGWQIPESTKLVETLAQSAFEQSTLDNIEEKREEVSSQEALQYIESALSAMLSGRLAHESCSVCNGRLGWNTETTSICSQGHLYDRCSLTLLSIQEPGITKSCASCNREYLTEKHLLKTDETSSPSARQLLADLLGAFSKCVYCNGHLQDLT